MRKDYSQYSDNDLLEAYYEMCRIHSNKKEECDDKELLNEFNKRFEV